MGWRRHRAASALWLAVLALPACGSGSKVELFVDLRTDLRPELEVTSVRTTVMGRGEGGAVEAERFRPVTVTDRLREGERVAELPGLRPGAKQVHVELRGPRAGVIASRTLSLELERDRLLEVVITSSCAGVECPGAGDGPSATECLGGLCVPPACLEAGSGACGPTQCETDDQCSVPSACARARCDGGVCIGVPDDEMCGEDELCSVSDGCRASPGTAICTVCSSERDCVDPLVCSERAEGGRVCLRPCGSDGPTCPTGFECAADDATGTELCQPSEGSCCVDEDGDRWGRGLDCAGRDCDDEDPDVNPAASETCNGLDDDCDEVVDEAPTECAEGRCLAVAGGTFEAIEGAACESGSCGGGSAVSCGMFACEDGTEGAGTCASSCDGGSGDDDDLCIESAHCDDGECLADLAGGEACDEDSDCESGSCESGSCAGGCVPTGETCNGSDDDCDGAVDEGGAASLCPPGSNVESTACTADGCEITSCVEPFGDCDGAFANGCEASLTNDATCGACDVACPAEMPVCLDDGSGFSCGSSCGDGECTSGETEASCPGDCGEVCGDSVCAGSEDACSCEADCGTSTCGDGVCCAAAGEDECTCSDDCGATSCGDGCCGGAETTATCPSDCGTSCGDGTCNGSESSTDCPDDCGTLCGDGTCNGSETPCNCEDDCGATTCGDGCCGGSEGSATCPEDCDSTCGDGTCNGSETSASCPSDCGDVCGDGACTGDEDPCSCAEDCGAGSCGDGTCCASDGETSCNCEEDCGATSCGDGCCGGSETSCDCPSDCGTSCGDGCCNGSESSTDCPEDCGSVCGDGECNGSETECNCPEDCGSGTCGDGVCCGAEGEDACSCSADCGPGTCGDGCCDDSEDACSCSADCSGTDTDGDGLLDCEDPAPEPVTLEGSATGEAASSSGVDTVQTAGSLPDLSDGLFIAAISTTPQDGIDVTSVSGLGLTWSKAAERCANDTQVEVWSAFGTPTMSEAVTVETDVNATSLVVAAFAYSGVDPSTPVGDTATAASNGCDGSVYDTQLDYSVSLTTSVDGAVAFGAVAHQTAAHTPGSGFTERAEVTASGVSFAAGVAVEDRTVDSAAALSVDGSFDAAIEWAAVAVELRP